MIELGKKNELNGWRYINLFDAYIDELDDDNPGFDKDTLDYINEYNKHEQHLMTDQMIIVTDGEDNYEVGFYTYGEEHYIAGGEDCFDVVYSLTGGADGERDIDIHKFKYWKPLTEFRKIVCSLDKSHDLHGCRYCRLCETESEKNKCKYNMYNIEMNFCGGTPEEKQEEISEPLF